MFHLSAREYDHSVWAEIAALSHALAQHPLCFHQPCLAALQGAAHGAVVAVLVLDTHCSVETDLAEQTPSDAPEDARAAAHLLSGYLTWASGAPA